MNICIVGGSGFIGTALSRRLLDEGHGVLVLDILPPKISHERLAYVACDLMKDPVPDSVRTCDALVHLGGASIFKRWTPAYKKIIRDSRVVTTRALADYACKQGIKTFVCASAVGFYGSQGENILTESSDAGTDFLASVCTDWEREALQASSCGVRVISVRTGIVLGPGGGMLSVLAPLFRIGLGGRMGSGKQWFSWVSLEDLVSIYYESLINTNLSGPINAVSPNPVRNEDMVSALARSLHRFAFIPVPGWVLHIVLGEFSRAILASARVIPQKLVDNGFVFQKPLIEDAIRNSQSSI